MQNDDKADIFIVFPECGKYSLVMRYVFLCCCIADCSENVTIIKKKKNSFAGIVSARNFHGTRRRSLTFMLNRSI